MLFDKHTVGRVGGALPPYRDQQVAYKQLFLGLWWSRYALRNKRSGLRFDKLSASLDHRLYD